MRRRFRILVLGLFTACSAPATGSGPAEIGLAPGDLFPDLRFDALVDSEDYGSLGLHRAEGAFSLSEVPGDVLLLDFFNSRCIPCQRQVRSVQEFFEDIAASGLDQQVRVLAVAAGNQHKYLPRFRAKRGLRFPIAADPTLERWRAFGQPGRTPFAVLLVRRAEGWVLADAHVGVRDEAWFREETLGHLAGGRPAEMEVSSLGQEGIPPALESEEEGRVVTRFLSRVVSRPVGVEPITLPDDSVIFRAAGAQSGSVLYARAGRRAPLCEICSGAYFLFAFDGTGRILGFEPILVHKWGNTPWTDSDARFLEGRLAGQNVSTLHFDEEVDAVTSATISSAIIFDEIRQARTLLGMLRRGSDREQ